MATWRLVLKDGHSMDIEADKMECRYAVSFYKGEDETLVTWVAMEDLAYVTRKPDCECCEGECCEARKVCRSCGLQISEGDFSFAVTRMVGHAYWFCTSCIATALERFYNIQPTKM